MNSVQIGQTVTGRCTSMGYTLKGVVSEILHPVGQLHGQSKPRYKIVNASFIDHPEWANKETAFIDA